MTLSSLYLPPYKNISTYLMFTTNSTRQRINNVVGGGAGGGGSIGAYIDY